MTSPFLAGQELRASALVDAVIRTAYAAASTSVTSSTTVVNASGLVMALTANTTYAWDAYLAYNSGATADIKIAWSGPSGATGHWGAYGVATGAVNGVGDLSAVRVNAYGSGNTIPLGGQDLPSIPGPMVCRPMGFIVVGATAGDLQAMFAQNTSNANATRIEAGSWLRVWKLA